MNRNHRDLKNLMLIAINNCNHFDLKGFRVTKKIGLSVSGYKLIWRF